MKFILTEQKHILKEYKFILNERFILTEAIIDDIKKIRDQIINKISNYKDLETIANKIKNLNSKDDGSDISHELDILKQKADEVDKIIQSKGGDDALKLAIIAYFEALKILFDKSKINPVEIPQTKTVFTDFDKAKTNPKADKLLSLYNKIAPIANGIFKDTKSNEDLSKIADAITAFITELNTLATQLTTELKDDALPTDETTQKYYERILTRLNDELPEKLYDANKFISASGGTETEVFDLNEFEVKGLMENITTASEAIKTFEAAYSKKDNEAVVNDIANSAKKDWKKYIGQINNEAGWMEYFKTEWDKDADKLMKLQLAFVQELWDLGFSNTTNPFIDFVKKYYLTDKLPLNNYTYAILHNAYVKKQISKEDLANGGPTLQQANIIFNPHLYENESAMPDYTKFQVRVLKNIKALSPTIKELYGGETINWPQLYTDMISNNGDPLIGKHGAIGDSLKDADQLNDNYFDKYFTGDVVEDEEEKLVVTDTVLKDWLAVIESKKLDKKMAIGYLWTMLHTTAQKVFKDFETIMVLPKTTKDFTNFDEIFKLNSHKDLTADQLTNLLTALKAE